MSDEQIRLRCRAKIKAMHLPRPFTLEGFRALLEAQRGRPLRIIGAKTAPHCSGLWIGTRDGDYIFYEQDTPRLHQVHIIAHETGHMIFGHKGPSLGHGLFPHLDSELVRGMLARSSYSDAEEREAETFASLLLEAADLPPSCPDTAAALSRVESVFGRTRPRISR